MSVYMCACVSLAAAKSNLCILHCHEIHEILYFYVRDIFWCSLPALSIWLGSNWPPHSQIERSAARNQMRLCVRLYWFMLLFFVVASALVVAVVTNRDPLEWVERGSETAGALFTANCCVFWMRENEIAVKLLLHRRFKWNLSRFVVCSVPTLLLKCVCLECYTDIALRLQNLCTSTNKRASSLQLKELMLNQEV